MIWDTLKKRLAAEIATKTLYSSENAALVLTDLATSNFEAMRNRGKVGDSWRHVLFDYRDAVYGQVMAWDIRCVGRLRDVFPDAFPRSLRKGTLTCYMDDKARWCVEAV